MDSGVKQLALSFSIYMAFPAQKGQSAPTNEKWSSHTVKKGPFLQFVLTQEQRKLLLMMA